MKLPRFHVRDLFWLVLVVGLSLGWGLESQRCHRRLAQERKQREATVVSFAKHLTDDGYVAGIDAQDRVCIFYDTWTETIDPAEVEGRTEELRLALAQRVKSVESSRARLRQSRQMDSRFSPDAPILRAEGTEASP